jgi:hypothetical protein
VIWTIRRGDDEFTAPDTATLQQWARERRIFPTDYVFNHTLNRWMFAHELPELRGLLAVPVVPVNRNASRGSCGLAIAMFLFAVMLGMMHIGQGLGVLLGAAAFVFAIVAGVLYVIGK